MSAATTTTTATTIHKAKQPGGYPLTALFGEELRKMPDRRTSTAQDGFSLASIRLRRLPIGTNAEAVRTMLLFAQDLQDTEMIPNEHEEDKGFSTAIARFASLSGASEAQIMLDGKPNTGGKASMIVEMLETPGQNHGFRRSTLNSNAVRPVLQTTSPPMRASLYNGQQFDMVSRGSVSPPMTSQQNMMAAGNAMGGEAGFGPQSPRNVGLKDRPRVSGKSVINQADGDTDSGDQIPAIPTNMNHVDFNSRRSSAVQLPTTAFSRLSLQTEIPGQTYTSGFYSPRSNTQTYTPRTPFSPSQPSGVSQGHSFGRGHLFPPVNPADQNPPCNTLYVGNLPMDTSEDELKAMFSKQRGYKRLCFRTKQNGPMCFVEFEDVSFATKALSDLYGAQLHNSVKGGIRLSFSKNPLGVRSGRSGNATGLSSPLNMPGPGLNQGMMPMVPGSFHIINGPPPGLSAPPGFSGPVMSPGHYHSPTFRSPRPEPVPDDLQNFEGFAPGP